MREKLRELRIKKGLKQKEMAEILNISRSFYGLIETGKRNPTLSLAKKIATFFNKSIDELFDDLAS